MIRSALRDDLDALVLIEQECFGPSAWSAPSVLAELTGDRDVLVADVDGVIGYCSIGPAGDDAELLRIAVRPSVQRDGLGGQLLSAGVEAARSRGAERLLLEVAATNEAALALYGGRGFTVIHRRVRYYPGGLDAVVMALDVDP